MGYFTDFAVVLSSHRPLHLLVLRFPNVLCLSARGRSNR